MNAPTGTPTGAPPRRRGWLVGLVVVLLGVVVGTGVGVAAGLGLGPFASDPPLPTFAPASYVDDPQPLRPTFAGASSQRPAAEGRAFGPELTADGDLATAWMTDEGDGARLRHTFEAPVWITSITLANGDQAEGGFDAHGRLREATVDLGNGQRLTVTFQDTPGEQQVTLPSPRITDEITWTVNEVVGGDDLAVAEVQYSGYVANEEDRQAFPDE